MKTTVVAVLLSLVYCAISLPQEYTNKFDNVDLDDILNSDRLLQNHVNCILDNGSCTPDGQELKSHIIEALNDGCAKCSEKHKTGIRKVIKFLTEKKPEIWKQIQAKYDPKGDYKKKYADLIKKEGVTV